MSVFPQYEDLMTMIAARSGKLPFYISIHSVRQTRVHHHDFVELTFMLEGSGSETINGVTHRMQPGVASFLLPHHIHHVESDSDRPLVKYCCMFDINLLFGSAYEAELSRLLFRVGSELPSSVAFDPALAAQMQSVLDMLHAEYVNKDGIGRNSFIRVKLTEAMLLFIRAAQAAADAPPPSGELSEAGLDFGEVLRFIHVHYAEPLTLDRLAEHCRVSAAHLSRSFKKRIGCSFLDYLHRLRVESAASMMRSTDMTLIDIAADAGFPSYRSFSRIFRDLQGRTPSEYRLAFKSVGGG
ncbi:AraC family transcriptional regulator [Paenibacillus cymbidii]|uniref:AraC family transcriptional regulator n=1 Tax=Paenibacillus cymbidii TaxID=1639034 RepID=UPI001436C88D|nr:AraC family transcriptional regulator [Paenibacillus cymbidii]